MDKRYTPKILINYLIKEFVFSLIIFISIFLSLVILINFIEELIFLREKNFTENIILKTFFLSLIKTPTMIISMSPFIFLFSGIFFFAKLLRSNEVTPLSLSGFSQNFITLIPASFSFILGFVIILLFTPISSELSKYYESVRQKFSNNDNLIIMSNTGLWLKEKNQDSTVLIRADKILNQDFSSLSRLTIYKFDITNSLIERIDAEKAMIQKDNWLILNGNKLKNNVNKNFDQLIFETNINLNKLKNYFTNSETFSIWNVNKELKQIRSRGYYGQELIITFNKYLSLPFLLFCMIILSTFFTIKIGYQFNNFIYAFFGVLSGITIYFLSDLSIAIGKSGRIPLIFSVWVPVIIIMGISLYSLIKENE